MKKMTLYTLIYFDKDISKEALLNETLQDI